MTRPFLILSLAAVLATPLAFGQDAVRVEPTAFQGPRPLASQTQASVIRDYLDAWKSLSAALDQNRPDLLGQDFVGVARDRFAQTIEEQRKFGLSARYLEPSHDIQIIFYSPEGLSIQLVDNIEYSEQLLDRGRLVTTQPVRARYVAVLTPSEVRWRVRVLQSETQ